MNPTVDALEPYFREVAPLLSAAGAPVEKAADAAHAARNSTHSKLRCPSVSGKRAVALDPATDLLEFDTAANCCIASSMTCMPTR